jgi:hypothetical protein
LKPPRAAGQDITQGGAGLWLRVDGASGTLTIDNAPLNITNGTTDWQRFAIDRYVDTAATQIVFGAFHFGNGTAWFDNVSVEIDGAPYAEAPPPNIGEPTPAQFEWLQQTANPFFTEKAGNGLDDLCQRRQADCQRRSAFVPGLDRVCSQLHRHAKVHPGYAPRFARRSRPTTTFWSSSIW